MLESVSYSVIDFPILWNAGVFLDADILALRVT